MRKTLYRRKSIERDRKIMKIITNKNQFQQAVNSKGKEYISFNGPKPIIDKSYSITFYGKSKQKNKQTEKPITKSLIKPQRKNQGKLINLLQTGRAMSFSQSLDQISRNDKRSRILEKLISKTTKNNQIYDTPLLISASQIIDFNSTFRPSRLAHNFGFSQPKRQSPKQIEKCRIDIQLDYIRMLKARQLRVQKCKNESNFERSLILNNQQKDTIRNKQQIVNSIYPQLSIYQRPKLNRKRHRQQNPQQFSPWIVAEQSQIPTYQF